MQPTPTIKLTLPIASNPFNLLQLLNLLFLLHPFNLSNHSSSHTPFLFHLIAFSCFYWSTVSTSSTAPISYNLYNPCTSVNLFIAPT